MIKEGGRESLSNKQGLSFYFLMTTSFDQAIELTESYFKKLEYLKPIVKSNRFIENSYAKIACKDIIRELKNSVNLPFVVTPLDVLYSYSNRMKLWASEFPDKEKRLAFLVAADTADYLKEKCWLIDMGWRKIKKERNGES